MDTTTPGTDNRRRRLCRYFASGHCSRGDSCRYRHDQPSSTGASRPPAPPGVCRKFYSTGTCIRRNTPAGCKYRHERPGAPNTTRANSTAGPSSSSTALTASRSSMRVTRRNVGVQSSANGNRGASGSATGVVPPVAASAATPASAPHGSNPVSQPSRLRSRRSQRTQPQNATATVVRVVVAPRVQRVSPSEPRVVVSAPVSEGLGPGTRSNTASRSAARQPSRAASEGSRIGSGDRQGRAATSRVPTASITSPPPQPTVRSSHVQPPPVVAQPVMFQATRVAANALIAPMTIRPSVQTSALSQVSLPGFPITTGSSLAVLSPESATIPPASRESTRPAPAAVSREGEEAELCAICYDVPALYGVLCGCRHMFCSQCILSWRSSGQEMARKCPICRVYSCHSAVSQSFIPDIDEGRRRKQRLFAVFHTHPTGIQYSNSPYSSWYETSPRSSAAYTPPTPRPANTTRPSSQWGATPSSYVYAAPPVRTSETRQGSGQATREPPPPGIATVLVGGVASLAVAAYRWWRSTG